MDTIFASALKLLELYGSQHSEAALKHEVREIKNNLAWVVDPEIVIIQQIRQILPGDPFEALIASYAFCIENVDEGFNWGYINNEIIARWGRVQLDYIKIQAWKEVAERGKEK